MDERLTTTLHAVQRWMAAFDAPWKAVLAGGLSSTIAYIVVQQVATDAVVRALLLALVLGAWHASADRPGWRFGVVSATAGLAIALGVDLLGLVEDRIYAPPFWDLTSFWILARAIGVGSPFYDPDVVVEFGRVVAAPDSFFREFRPYYPPPFMALVMPIGSLDLGAAAAVWYVVQVDFLVLAIIAIWRVMLAGEGWPGLPLAAAVALACPATIETFSLGQTNATLLFLLVPMFLVGERRRAGAAIVLGVVIKPLFASLILLPLLRRQVNVIAAAAVTALGVFALTSVALGPGVWLEFLTSGLGGLSAYPFTQDINQSIIAGAQRLLGDAPDDLLLIVAVLSVTVVVFVAQLIHAARSRDDIPPGIAVGIVISLTLLLYPATLSHYYMLLVAPIAYLWWEHDRAGYPRPLQAVVVGVVFVLFAVDGGGVSVVGGMIFAGVCIWLQAAALGHLPTPAATMAAAAPLVPRITVRQRIDTILHRR